MRVQSLDGDLPAERLRVWRERLGHSRDDHFVQMAFAERELAGFVCAYGRSSRVRVLHDGADTAERRSVGARMIAIREATLADVEVSRNLDPNDPELVYFLDRGEPGS